MPYAGDQLQPREVADLINVKWPQNRVKATATTLAESQGYISAYHLNYKDDGVTLASEDCGIMQVNVGASEVGGPREFKLLTDPVYNISEARELYDSPMIRNGVKDKRRFQPWVSYTSGWATFPEFWTWHQQDGEPVGPWVATGRYLTRAIAGVANWHQVIAKDMSTAEALEFAKSMGTRFEVKVVPTIVTQKGTGLQLVTFVAPRKPTNPPADGVGPRPKPNDGV